MPSCMSLLFAVFLFASVVSCITVPYSQTITCNTQPSGYCGYAGCNIWYIDPQNGLATNNGTLSSPWRNLNDIVPSKVDGFELSQYPWNGIYPFSNLTRPRPNAPIKMGDVIVLLAGNYTNTNFNLTRVHNIPPITITQLPHVSGNGVHVDKLNISSTGGWNIYCLNFTTSNANPDQNIIHMPPNDYLGPSNDVRIENCTFYSYTNLETYRGCKNCLWGASAGAILVRGDNCSVVNNYIYYIKRGVTGQSTNQYIAKNWINYLIGDGFRIIQNNSLVEYNRVTNSMVVDNNTLDHRDYLQMYTTVALPPLVNVTIRYNFFDGATDPYRPFADDSSQGIDGFDCPLHNITVVNNFVNTNQFHGITLFYPTNCTIAGNTVVSLSNNLTSNQQTWIMTNFSGPGNVVANNIAPYSLLDPVTPPAIVSGNVFKYYNLTMLSRYFVDPVNHNYHLVNVSDSPYVAKGVSIASLITPGPNVDMDGYTRVAPYDVGAYVLNGAANPSPSTVVASTSPAAASSGAANPSTGAASPTPVTSTPVGTGSGSHLNNFLSWL